MSSCYLLALHAALALLALPAACAAAPVRPALAAALAADNYHVVSSYNMSSGTLALRAESNTATIGNTSRMKPLYYLEGASAYELGFALAQVQAPELEEMCTQYIDHILMSLLDQEIDEQLQNSSFAPVYDAFLVLITDLVENDAMKSFNNSLAVGAFPQYLIDQMHGIADGSRARNASTQVDFSKIATLNFGYDFLLALIYTGEIFSLLLEKAAAWAVTGRLQAVIAASPKLVAASVTPESALTSIANIPKGAIHPPIFCDAFAVSGAATASGNSSFFARDFQFALALTFQDVQSVTLYMPTGALAAEHQPIACVGAPALIGCMTALNPGGTAMGVDVVQAGFANTTIVGINSLLMVRATIADPRTLSSEAAVRYIAGAQRGVPWIYPLSDATGDARIVESGPTDVSCASVEPGACEITLDYTAIVAKENATLAALLPSTAQLKALLGRSIDYRRGIFVRNSSAHMPLATTIIPTYNPALFASYGVPYPQNDGPAGNISAWGAHGYVFKDWRAERAAHPLIAAKFFSPDRFEVLTSTPDVRAIAVSNLALTPFMRIPAMMFWCSITGMGSPQWRYDALSDLVLAHAQAGNITMEVSKDMISFLAPWRQPGFYNESTIEGIMSVADLGEGVLESLGGYWGDDWTRVSLRTYVAALPAA